jgi:hypothetical protein
MSKSEGEIDNSQYRTIEEILQINQRNTDRLKKELEIEEQAETIETIDGLRNAMKADVVNTNQQKAKFISSLHDGMIEEIKRNKGIIKVTPEVTSWVKFKGFIKGLFTKF